MTLLADLLTTVFDRRYKAPSAVQSSNRPIEELVGRLMRTTADTTSLALAAEILSRYAGCDDAQKLGFFRFLATDLDIDPDRVRATLDAYEQSASRGSYLAFMTAAEPRRQELIRRLNKVPNATQALVRMRADLLALGRGEPALEALDWDFRHLFTSWFNRGFLVLRPINWESPAHILEKIIAYEAVHTIDSWDDLRRRLQPADRRCFAFFHPAMPDEPLIFVEVALTSGIPNSIQGLLAEDRAPIDVESADAAAFYSISNCQDGLANISFGSSLIKQVANDLSAECPGLKTFVTLSPIPGLTHWAYNQALTWDAENPEATQALAAAYLLTAKRDNGHPLDPVARFHLGNGAVVHAVHGGADISEKGLAQSGGAMVNYLYDLPSVAENHEKFVADKRVIATRQVTALAEQFTQKQPLTRNA